MKKWVIGLSILLGISMVGTATTAGTILKNEIKTYEEHLEERFQGENLKHVTVVSEVPLTVETTKGNPYITFDSKVTGIFDKESKHQIVVKEEGDATRIHIKKISEPQWMQISATPTEIGATLYLPEKELESLQLDVTDSGYHYINLDYNAKFLSVKDLDIKGRTGNIMLEGNYETVTVEQDNGTLIVKSPSKIKAYLRTENTRVDLKGQYEEINLQEVDGEVNIESTIPTKLTATGTSYHTLYLKGAFETIAVDGHEGEFFLKATNNPKNIQVFGNRSKTTILLPQNTPGFQIVSAVEQEEGQRTKLHTDFPITEVAGSQLLRKASYGDSSTKIFVEAPDYDNNFYILNSGEDAQQ